MRRHLPWFGVIALVLTAGCVGGPDSMPPEEALKNASREVDAILKDEANYAAPPLESPRSTDRARRISFWYFDHPILAARFNPVAGDNAFSRTHPGIELVPQFIGEWDVAVQKLTVALAADDLPDVAVVKRSLLARLIPSGRITPIDTLLPPSLLDDLRAPSREAFTVNGTLYALPADGFCNVLVYARGRIEPPRDVQQLKTIQGKAVLGYLPFLPLLWSAGGHVFTDDTSMAAGALGTPSSLLESGSARETLDFFLGLRDRGIVAPRMLGDETRALQAFLAGDVPMTVTSSEAWPRLQGLSFPVDMAPIPGKDGPTSLLSDNAIVVFRRYADAKHDALVEFLDFLTGPDVLGAAAAERGSVPVRKSVAAQVRVPEGLAAAYDVAKATPLHPGWSRIEDALDRYLRLAYVWEKPSSTPPNAP